MRYVIVTLILFLTSLPALAQDAAREYQRLLSRRTASEQFDGFASYQSMNPYNHPVVQGTQAAATIYNTAQWHSFNQDWAAFTGISPGYYNTQLALGLGAMGLQAYANHSAQQRVREQLPKVEITATVWDTKLTRAYARYVAERDGRSAEDVLFTQQQRNLDEGAVELRIRNIGYLPVNLAPMRSRVFLMSDEGHPIAATSTAYSLDRQLRPGEEAVGRVRFLDYALRSDEVTLVFKGVMGGEGELSIGL